MKKHDEIIVRNLYEKFTYDYILEFFFVPNIRNKGITVIKMTVTC